MVLLALLVHVGDDQRLGDVGGVGAPVAVLLQDHDGESPDCAAAPCPQTRSWGSCAPPLVWVSPPPTTWAVPVLPAKSTPCMCAPSAVWYRPGDVAAAMPSVMVIQVSSVEGHVLVAGAGEAVEQGLAELGWKLAGIDHVGADEVAVGGDAAKARANWMGVTWVSPWPMPTEMVLPA